MLGITFCGCNNPKFIRKYVQLESVIDNINSDIRSSGLDDKIDTSLPVTPVGRPCQYVNGNIGQSMSNHLCSNYTDH